MKRSAVYFPLAIFVVLGLALSLIPANPVLGDNIPGCKDGPASSARVVMAGRVLTPANLLQAGQPCAVGETTFNMVSLTRTVVVSPVGSATANGTALLSAMNFISNSNPSASNPWLLKLEPGNYDLGGQSLILNSFVDLEGSGEDITVISSIVSTPGFPPTKGVVVMSSTTELRFVKVLSTGSVGTTASTGVFLANATGVRVNQTTIQVTANGGYSYGIFTNGGAVTVLNSTISASGGSGDNIAMYSSQSGNQTVHNSFLTGSGGGAGRGLLSQGTAKIANTVISSTSAPVFFFGSGTISCASTFKDTGTAYVALAANCA